MTGGQIAEILLLQLAMLLCCALFSACDTACTFLSVQAVESKQKETGRSFSSLLQMLQHPTRFLSTVQTGKVICIAISAVTGARFVLPLATWAHRTAGVFLLPVWQVAAAVVSVFLFAVVHASLAFRVPRQIARRNPYAVALALSPFIRFWGMLLRPLAWCCTALGRAILRLLGIPAVLAQEELVTEDAIRKIVDAGIEHGTIDTEEKEMIENVFALDTLTARDVMTHRVDVLALDVEAEAEDIVRLIEESGISRYPVYEGSFDNILGILNTRTYLLNLRQKQPKKLRDLLRPACFVPETVPADVLLRDIQQRKEHMALVLDEYGGFSGIVTLEDLLEEIVGNIYDEFDTLDEPEIYKLGENVWRVAGDADLELLEEELGVQLPQERDFDTLGGLVFSQLSFIPDEGKEVELDIYGLHIHTEPIEDHHVEWARVSLQPDSPKALPPQGNTTFEEGKRPIAQETSFLQAIYKLKN